MLGKAFSKAKELSSKGLEKGRDFAEKKIHEAQRKNAVEVLNKTQNKVSGKNKDVLDRARQIVATKFNDGGGVGNIKIGNNYYFKTNDGNYIYGKVNDIIKYSGDIEFQKDKNSDDTVYPSTFLIRSEKIKNLFKEIPKVTPYEYESLVRKYIGQVTGEEPSSIKGIGNAIETKEKSGKGLMVFSTIQKYGRVNFNENAILKIKGKSFDKDGIKITFTNISKQNNSIYSQNEYANFVYDFSFKIKYSNLYAEGGGIPNNYEAKSPKDIWNMWTNEQRKDFLHDHQSDARDYDEVGMGKGYYYSNDIDNWVEMEWNQLPSLVKNLVFEHTDNGQYANGGGVGTWTYEIGGL